MVLLMVLYKNEETWDFSPLIFKRYLCQNKKSLTCVITILVLPRIEAIFEVAVNIICFRYEGGRVENFFKSISTPYVTKLSLFLFTEIDKVFMPRVIILFIHLFIYSTKLHESKRKIKKPSQRPFFM